MKNINGVLIKNEKQDLLGNILSLHLEKKNSRTLLVPLFFNIYSRYSDKNHPHLKPTEAETPRMSFRKLVF